jgi:hypothetical protein
MEPSIPYSVILRNRNRAYGRTPDRRVRTPAAARRFVKRVGFCLFWPTRGVEAPTLLHAIAGRAIPLGAGYKHPAFGRSWNWKDEALDKRWWYYGRLLRGRATLVSLDFLPAFYALSENYGDPNEYLLEYQDGRLSADAKAVYEALLHSGPLDTVRLRKEARLAGESAKTGFQRAMTELQEGLKVLPVGVAEAGAWDYAFVYDLVSRWLPTLDVQARRLTTLEARRRILLRHLDNVVAIGQDEIRRFLGWPAATLAKVIAPLSEIGEVETLPVMTERGTVSMLAAHSWARRLRSSLRIPRRPAKQEREGPKASATRRR